MGTRSLTRVFDPSGVEIICMYRQFDGYLSGHGKELAEFLASGEVVNGITVVPANYARVFNGADDLAAQLVTWFKLRNTLDNLPFNQAIEDARDARTAEMLDPDKVFKASEVFQLVRRSNEAVVAALKATMGVCAGGVYLQAPGTHGVGEDYTYEVFVDAPGEPLRVRVTSGWSSRADEPVLYDGDVAGLLALANKEKD